ncbi:kinase [Rhodococcus sp. BGS-1C]|uniref:kinase n=1 Tax=unclassified Rhodococcus (in: high G+C Gram-positive bacteria) TaxID=192944 RepID=UPI000963029C|nr:kinase [Rhodococcus sp. KRD197]OLT35104.1 kinase [Rhodococcus sp. CUA-806]
MTAILADPVSEVVAAAQRLLTRRTGASVTLVDPVDLGGSGQATVVRVRVSANPFQLPRTLVVKQVRDNPVESSAADGGGQSAFLREAASYQFANALATDSRPGPELLAYDLSARLLVLSDLGDASPITALLKHSDAASVTNSLMAMAQALGRMHAATVGREDDFAALLRRVGLPNTADGITAQIPDALVAVPRMLADELGIAETPSAFFDRVERSGRLFAHGTSRAFSPSDLCPDNIIVNEEGVRFLDYEWGGFRDATLDITYALASFPGCLCHFDLSAELAQAMIDAWRSEVVGIWPHLADDAVLASKILDAQLIWVWLTTYWFLPNDHTRIAAARAHHLSVPRSDALLSRWSALVDQAVTTGDSDVADFARRVVAALEAKWDR